MDDIRDQGRPGISDKPGNSVLSKVDEYHPLVDTLYITGSGSTSHSSLARQGDQPLRIGSARVLPGDQQESQQKRGDPAHCSHPALRAETIKGR
jgi:hypothetical protein